MTAEQIIAILIGFTWGLIIFALIKYLWKD